MSTNTHISNAERFGNWLGRGWRGYVRQERQVAGWLVAQGAPAAAATAMVWIAKLAVLGVLLYVAFWLALLIVVAGVVVWMQQDNAAEEPDFLGRKAEERDHRESLFYHPVCFNDDPDPRFEDD
jgi:fatty acid desaturase